MRKNLNLLLINAAILLLLALAIDPLIGYFSPNEKEHAVNRWVLLREFPPGYDKLEFPDDNFYSATENLEYKAYRLRTDNRGFILGDDVDPPDSVDIIFFGGSTTECIYVDEDARFPYLVGTYLVDSIGRAMYSANAGVRGNNSMHSAVALLAKGIPLRPKLVVLMHNFNDLALLTKTASYWNAPDDKAIVQQDQSEFRNFLVATKNLFFPNLYATIKRLLKRKPDDEWEGYGDAAPAQVNIENIQDKFRSSLMSFVLLAKAWRLNVALMTQFNRIHENDQFTKQMYGGENGITYEEFVKYYERFNETTREVAAAEHVLLIDLDRAVPANSSYMYDAAHLNNNGSRFVANVVAKEIADHFAYFKLKQ